MKTYKILPCIHSRLTIGQRKPGAILMVAVCLLAVPVISPVKAEFWHEDLTDGNLSDAGIEWFFLRDHSIATEGLLLSTDRIERPTVAAPKWPADRQGWSIRTRARLQQDHGFFGPAILSNNFGQTEGPPAAVPEPSGLALSLLGLLTMGMSRRRKERLKRRESCQRSLRMETMEERRMLSVVTVNTDQDIVDPSDQLTSLREAVEIANGLKGADEIAFDFGHDDPVTIRLEHGELELTDAVAITGSGQGSLTIDAQHQSRIFKITAKEGDFDIEGLTLTGSGDNRGNARDEPYVGGAIHSDTAGLLTLRNSAITNRVATYPCVPRITAAGDVTIQSSIVSGNICKRPNSIWGHVVYTSGHVTVSSSTITENSGGIIAAGVTIRSSTISRNGGEVLGAGGANWPGIIMSAGEVTVSSSTISQNSVAGIRASGNVTVSSSTISGNQGGIEIAGFGARIAGGIRAGGDLAITSSTISGNTLGGIAAGGITTINSSTISGNTGGGISAGGNAIIKSSTITGNLCVWADCTHWGSRDAGVKFFRDLILENSIVAANQGGDLAFARPYPPIVELGRSFCEARGEECPEEPPHDPIWSVRHSLIGHNRGTRMVEAPVGSPDANGNLIGGRTNGVIDARLAPLRDNGGPTFTHALLPDSPAINMGDPSAVIGANDSLPFDQRGKPYSRVVDGRIDIGAFERGVPGDANGDGKVDFADFLILASHFGTGEGWAEGNFDGSEDGTQFADFLVLANNFGYEEPGFSDRQWYVRASTTTDDGDGSRANPFSSLAAVAQASEPGDTIFVLHTPLTVPPLDGGIVLKNGQKLFGVHPDVTGLSEDDMPRLTNTTADNQGDAVVLAENNEIRNLHILNTQRSAIYGENVVSAIISNNLISSSNQGNSLGTTVTVGQWTFIGSFGGIHLVADGQGAISYEITDNIIQDGTFTGISISHSGSTNATITLLDNRISDLQPPQGADTNQAVLLSTDAAAVVNASLKGTFIDNLGAAHSNSDAIVVFVDGTSQQTVKLENHTQRNTNRVGNESATGMEVLTLGEGNVVNIEVRDAYFSDLNADALQNIYLGEDGHLKWQVENTVTEDGKQNGFRSITVKPVNTLDLRFRNDRFLGMTQSGITLEAHAPIDTLAVLVEESDFLARIGLLFTGSNGVSSHAIDLGGGALGSIGQNRIEGRRAIISREMAIQAAHNWWGDPAGPSSNTRNTVETEPALAFDPRP